MAREKKVKKEDIIQASLELLQNEGVKNLTARKLASYLNASTQPIYKEFGNMNHLKKNMVDLSYGYMMDNVFDIHHNEEFHLNSICFNYIKFAKENPRLFNSMFNYSEEYSLKMHNHVSTILDELLPRTIEVETPLSGEDKYEFKRFVWPAIHGAAVMINQGVLEFKEERVLTYISYHVNKFLLTSNK